MRYFRDIYGLPGLRRIKGNVVQFSADGRIWTSSNYTPDEIQLSEDFTEIDHAAACEYCGFDPSTF